MPGATTWLAATVRLFAAVDPPADAVTALSDFLGDSRAAQLRWVASEQWHLTLAFYGEVDEARAQTLTAGLERAALRSRSMSLRLAGAGTFPRQTTRARVLWIGIDGDVDEMRRLADRCAGAGRRARIAMEARKFRAHLTLARAQVGAVDATDIATRLATYSGPWWTASSLRLVSSRLGAQVQHETLREFPLASGAPVTGD